MPIMDEIIMWGLLILFIVAVCLLLGVRGWVVARGVRRDLAALRHELREAGVGVSPAKARPEPVFMPATPPGEWPGGQPQAWPEAPPGAMSQDPAWAAVPAPPAAEPVPAEPAVVPVEEPVPVAAAVKPAEPAAPSRSLEETLTLRWGVWLGAGALLLAVVFLIRYMVEQELLGPEIRMIATAVLGVALVCAAEWARRRAAARGEESDATAIPDYVPGALAAGGVAALLGAAYGAGPYYNMLTPLLAFVLMAGAAFAGLALSLRFGPLTAAVGLAGGFATPALVSTGSNNLVGLFAYLLALTAACMAVVRLTAWAWLGWAATVAGALWVLLVAHDFSNAADLWAAALFVPAGALVHLLLLPGAALEHPVGRKLGFIPFLALGLAGLVLTLATRQDVAVYAVLLMSAVAIWQGMRERRLDYLPWIAAAQGLLALLNWQLPYWSRNDAKVMIEGREQAVFLGDWVPEALVPFVAVAAVFALLHAAAGWWQERRSAHPLRWAALPAAVPVLTMAIAYARIRGFQADVLWGMSALVLAAALIQGAWIAISRASMGVYAAGAVAAVALAFATVLADHWLTMTISLLLPALAWIEAKADLPALRRVALAVAGVVLVRLLLNWYVLDYTYGETPILNGLLVAYGVPALAFFAASRMFRARAVDLLVTVLEAGAVVFATVLIATEIQHGMSRMTELNYGQRDFLALSLHVLALGAQALGLLWLNQRAQRVVLNVAWRVLGVLALLGGAWAFPAVLGVQLFGVPVFNVLLLAFGLPAALALAARSMPEIRAIPLLRRYLSAYALAAVFVWVTLETYMHFHPGFRPFVVTATDAELWTYSGVWLALGVALMAAGIRFVSTQTRLAALAVIGLVVFKVFLIDMSELTGLWRVLSFLGLGLTLIGLGAVSRRFVFARRKVGAEQT